MKYTHLLVVSVPVSDQQRAKDFYVNTLGFELRAEGGFGEGQNWVEVTPAGAQTSLTLVNWFPSMPPGSLKGLVIGCEDIEVAYQELSNRGLTFHSPIIDEPWGRFSTFDDPDGNTLILQQNWAAV